MVRLALAAIALCLALVGAAGQTAPSACTPAGDQGEWRAQPQAAASITDSAWKYRDLHATVAAAERPVAVDVEIRSGLSVARAIAAPSYLLHTPLLI